jgi:cytochrome c biogenesis protein CcmG/thiol:disulfide interchange protein DsbE
MTNRGQWIAVGGVLAAIGGVLVAAVTMSSDLAPVSLGSRAPAFRAVSLADGDSVGLDHFAGDVVLLNIWATWCAPCEEEMPSIQRLYDEMAPQGLKLVSVSVEFSNADAVRQWLADRRLTFPVLLDKGGRIEDIYQTTGVPETFVLDRNGVIVKKVIGATAWDAPAQKALIRRLLAEHGQAQSGG